MNTVMVGATLMALVLTADVTAQEAHEIQMLNRGSDRQNMVFEPAYLNVAPGDTITFVNAQGMHNAATIEGMLPESASEFNGRIGETISFVATEEGLYGIKCTPHYGAGMVALIKVGDGAAPNFEEARAVRHPGLARRRIEALFELAEADQQ